MSLILRNQAPNLMILTHSNICKSTKKTRSKMTKKNKVQKTHETNKTRDDKPTSQRDLDTQISHQLIKIERPISSHKNKQLDKREKLTSSMNHE